MTRLSAQTTVTRHLVLPRQPKGFTMEGEAAEVTSVPEAENRAEKDAWDKAKVVLYGALVAAVIVGGWYYRGVLSRQQSLRQHNVEMLRVAVEILREDPAPHRRPLREWAVNTMDTFSRRTGVPLGDSARRILLDQPLTQARNGDFVLKLRQRLYNLGVNPALMRSLLPGVVERHFNTVEELVSYVVDGGAGRSPSTYLPPDTAYSLVRGLADSLGLVRRNRSRRDFLNLPVTALSGGE